VEFQGRQLEAAIEKATTSAALSAIPEMGRAYPR
jgi:hypothetical protein